MKNFVKVASLAATLALAACQTNPNTTAFPKEDPVKSRNVASTDKTIWLSGDYGYNSDLNDPNRKDRLCWQTGYYPDGNPIPGCDAIAVVPPTKQPLRLVVDAGALFDFDKATLRPVGVKTLTAIGSFLRSVNFGEAVITGHTDSFGTDAYNDRLSARRAEAVKAFLVSQGVSANQLVTQGMGKRQLIVDPKTCKGNRAARIACEQPNRRVEVGIANATISDKEALRWRDVLSVEGVRVQVNQK